MKYELMKYKGYYTLGYRVKSWLPWHSKLKWTGYALYKSKKRARKALNEVHCRI